MSSSGLRGPVHSTPHSVPGWGRAFSFRSFEDGLSQEDSTGPRQERQRTSAVEELEARPLFLRTAAHFGIGWVCENHPDRAWHDELGRTYGAGEPCECNRADEPDVSEVTIEENRPDTRKHAMAVPTEEQIRVRARELWEKAGKPEGRDDVFWHQAERELQQENLTQPPDNLPG